MKYISNIKSNFNKKSMFLIQLIITIISLCYIGSKINFSIVFKLISGISTKYIIFLCSLLLLQFYISIFKWQFILKTFGYNTKLSFVTFALMLERFVNQIIPGLIIGDYTRSKWLAIKNNTPNKTNTILKSSLWDRLLSVACLALLTPLSIIYLYLHTEFKSEIYLLTLVLFFFISILILTWITPKVFWSKLLDSIKHDFIKNNLIALIDLIKTPNALLISITYSFIIHCIGILMIITIAYGANIHISNIGASCLLPLIFLAGLIPVSINGWGFREGSMIFLFGSIGLSTNEAVSISILYGLSNIFLGIMCGVIWFLYTLKSKNLSSQSLSCDEIG